MKNPRVEHRRPYPRPGKQTFAQVCFLLLSVIAIPGCSEPVDYQSLDTGEANLPPLAVSNEPLLDGSKAVRFVEEFRLGSEDLDELYAFFGTISDIEIGSQGEIYVLDDANYVVKKFSKEGEILVSFGGEGQGPGEFLKPKKMAIDDRGRVYVTDTMKLRVLIFDTDGEFLGGVPTQVIPAHLAVGPDDDIFLTGFFDFGDFRIHRLSSENGTVRGQFCDSYNVTELVSRAGEAGHVYVDSAGDLYFSFFYPYDVRKYTAEGEAVARFARKASFFRPPKAQKKAKDVMMAPTGVAQLLGLPNGNIMVVLKHVDITGEETTFSSHFDIFTPEGKWLLSFSPDALETNWIRNVAVDREGKLYLDYAKPFPHIRRYAMIFEEAGLDGPDSTASSGQ
ncbi:MAG: 6-bladed beta-propeller [bacterium]|nr:6-bladed beta-propeller [bacterium]